jgi:hypothetical protein
MKPTLTCQVSFFNGIYYAYLKCDDTDLYKFLKLMIPTADENRLVVTVSIH